MNKNIQEKITDITGIELAPGKPTVCLGNGEQGFECCCDECDYFGLCFPEFDLQIKEENIAARKIILPNSQKMTENIRYSLSFLSVNKIFFFSSKTVLKRTQPFHYRFFSLYYF